MTFIHTTPIAVGLALALVGGVATISAASGLLGGRAVVARAAAKQETFTIAGRVVRPLSPGRSGALNLRLTNRQPYSLRISQLFVSLHVDRAHVRAGCDRTANYRIQRLRADQYPIGLGPRRTRSLSQLNVRPLPRVLLRMLRSNQDACKGAVIALRFSGRAQRWNARTR